MKRKRYLAGGLVLVGAVALGLAGWGYAGSATAMPGNTCDLGGGSQNTPGCHVKATTTTKAPATTTTKAPTATTKAPSTGTTGGATTTTTGASTSTSVTLSGAETSFSDVPSTHPYYTQISDMATRQVISGDAEGNFKPDLPVTRQDFAKMIVKALDLALTGDETSPFTDLDSGQDADPLFPEKYVAVCAVQGITVGKTSTTFAPDDDLTRQQLITMVVRAAKVSDPPADFTTPFAPGQFYPDEHYANASKAASAKLLDGLQAVDSAYDFMLPATRGEVAVMLYNLIMEVNDQ